MISMLFRRFLPAANEFAKVMFPQVFVCPQVGREDGSASWGDLHPGGSAFWAEVCMLEGVCMLGGGSASGGLGICMGRGKFFCQY